MDTTLLKSICTSADHGHLQFTKVYGILDRDTVSYSQSKCWMMDSQRTDTLTSPSLYPTANGARTASHLNVNSVRKGSEKVPGISLLPLQSQVELSFSTSW